ncbi:MAG: hypothetical protein HY735_16850 [Verrucomicrobia bacterium]|nr:hypothetical protein [Verrucomicrobiota bacterium]
MRLIPTKSLCSGLIHELQAQQIELLMQNESLRKSSMELEQANERLKELYDLAPVGCVTLGSDGSILECNRTACAFFEGKCCQTGSLWQF